MVAQDSGAGPPDRPDSNDPHNRSDPPDSTRRRSQSGGASAAAGRTDRGSLSPSPAVGEAARARDVWKVYGSGEAQVVALRGISADFARARFTAIMGPSGSGKSTLMHCLAGLDTVDRGAVWVGDQQVTGLSDAGLTRLRRDRVGFIFQQFNLLPTLTARENILLPLTIAGRRPDPEWYSTVIDTIGLGDRLSHRPSQLSGGQQQRVACARALISRPDVVFADEPTGNLDSRSGAQVLGFLRESVRAFGQTIVMVTHDPNAASYADRVVFLADGQLVDELNQPTAERVLDRMRHLDIDSEGGSVRVMLRSLLTRKLRLLLSVLAVVLGTMFMAGACTAGDTTTRGFQELFATINSNVDVEVTAKQQGPQQQGSNVVTAVVPAAVADQVAALPGVRSVTRLVSSDGARLVGRNGKVVSTAGAPQFGTNWVPSGTLAHLQQGNPPQSTDQIAINRALADQTGYRIGDRVQVLTLAPARTFTLVGIFGYQGGRDSLSGASEVSFVTPAAQQLMLGRLGVYSSLALHADSGVSPERLKSTVSSALGPNYVVRTGDEAAKAQSGQISGFLDVLRNGLVGFALVALFVGAFLIFNTFSMLVAQRTRELALLRAMGASRRQVTLGVLGEAALTGLVASAIGLLLGIGVGWLLVRLLERGFGGPLPYRGVVVKPGVVIGVLLIGTVMTVVATMAPALRASRVPPVAAMRAAETPDKPLRRLTFVGVVTLAIGIVLFGVKLFWHVGTGTGGTIALLGGGVVLCFLGVAMISPLIARPVTAAVGLLLAAGAPGQLGRRNTGRNPRRTAVTAAALMIGVALVTGAAVFASSAKAGIDKLIGRDLGADLIVSTGFTAAPTGGFPPSQAEKIRQLDGVSQVVAVSSDRVRLAGSDIDAAALFDVESAVPLFHLATNAGEVRTPTAGEVLLDQKTADARHLGVGDTTTLATARAGTPRPVRVIGIYADNQLASAPVVSGAAAETFTSPNARQAYVKVADPAQVPQVRAELDQLFASYPDVTVNDQSQVTSAATRPLDVLLATITVLLGLAIVVAVLGVINTLLLSILERTREIGLLRAVGLSRGQTMRMVTVESVLISIFGALLGIVVGMALGVTLVSAVGGDFLQLTIPWGYLVAALVLGVVAGVVAAIIPAVRASRLNVLEAIAYE